MIKKVTIRNLRITFSMARITKVVGVNSQLADGKHILMWDFDNVSLEDARRALRVTQLTYELPTIRILNSGKADHWLAYCFKRLDWMQAVRIIASTELVDYNFFKYGVYRGRFTLRVSPKEQKQIKYATILLSYIPEDCSVDDLNSWVRYETLRGR